jgi:hypothetical protein
MLQCHRDRCDITAFEEDSTTASLGVYLQDYALVTGCEAGKPAVGLYADMGTRDDASASRIEIVTSTAEIAVRQAGHFCPSAASRVYGPHKKKH